MKELEMLTSEEKTLSEAINQYKEKLRTVRQAIAELSCPFVVGDRVVNDRGLKGEVSCISYSGWARGKYGFNIRKIKKNGDLYKESSHAYGEWVLDNQPQEDL